MRLTHFHNSWAQLLALVLVTLLVILFVEMSGVAPQRAEEPEPAVEPDLPDFTRFNDVSKRKAEFFGFLRPVARAANREVEKQRTRLKQAAARLEQVGSLPDGESGWIRRMAERYRVAGREKSQRTTIQDLLKRVDTIPVSLILAQAAKESAWGTSRFARQGNNLFGEWCFNPGCGLVPARRDAGKTHEVERFDTVRASVASYIHNLNSHPRYEDLRAIRARQRRSGGPVTGFALAAGLDGYSAHGQEYVKSVRAIIRHNDLGPMANADAEQSEG
ncbi:glucosaminidase domain-containing protein [Thiohalorhabdus sp. Cl-TMA]|uniref:Glucosaminidase domain-containing protein n=1 Tax=Thiohalorhabdus methylotrophus TaxID=3242694 RepID=A0ABV4TV17_9GAMM